MAGLGHSLKVWANVYQRIRFFRRMYPLSSLVKDLALFPLDYLRQGRPVRRVRNLTLAITHRCNIKCQMCYFHEELGDRRELPLELYQRILAAVAPARPCVILSGGEPFTHPHLLKMVALAKGLGLPAQIFTNGTLARPELCDRLVELGLDYMNLTLLGDPQSHDQVARVPGSYQRLLANLEHLAAHRGRTLLVLNYTISPGGLGGLEHAVELAARLRLDGLRIQHFNFLQPHEFAAQERVMAKLFGQSARTHEIAAPPDVAGLAQEVLDFQASLPRRAPGLPVQWAPTLTSQETRLWYSEAKFHTSRKCLYPWRGMLVDADGKLYPCSKIYLELGDLNQEDIWRAFNSGRMLEFRSRLKQGLFPACSRCCKL